MMPSPLHTHFLHLPLLLPPTPCVLNLSPISVNTSPLVPLPLCAPVSPSHRQALCAPVSRRGSTVPPPPQEKASPLSLSLASLACPRSPHYQGPDLGQVSQGLRPPGRLDSRIPHPPARSLQKHQCCQGTSCSRSVRPSPGQQPLLIRRMNQLLSRVLWERGVAENNGSDV